MNWKIVGLILLVSVGVYYFYSSQSVAETKVEETTFIEPVNFEYYPPAQPTNILVILLHGGSWMAGDKQQLYGVGQYLSEHGMSVINMDYRLAPEWQYDAPLQDIATMIKQVDANKEVYALADNYRLVLLGFSAGGHLVSQFSVSEDKYGVRQVDECISLAGIYDLDRIIKNQDGPLLKEAVTSFLGKTGARQASPLYLVSEGEPTRFLLVRGSLDKVVSTEQMRSFVAKLQQKKVGVEEMIVPEKDHLGIFNTISLGDEVAQKILEFIY